MQIENNFIEDVDEAKVMKLAKEADVPVWLASMVESLPDNEALNLLDLIKSKRGSQVKNVKNLLDYQAIIEEIVGFDVNVKLNYHKHYYTFRKLLSEYLTTA